MESHSESETTTQTQPESVKSNWPLPLVLDETWLRSRRVLVHALEKWGLWMSTPEYETFIGEQREIGNRLKYDLLQPVLGPDYRALSSESIFGTSNGRFRSKLPLALAFGYEIGLGLSCIYGGDESNDAPQIAAVFNLGISIFDLIHDHFPELAMQFSHFFNGDVLLTLQDDPSNANALLEDLDEIEAIELRLLLRIIGGFFRLIHQLSEKYTPLNELNRRLLAAYRAEVRSSDNLQGAKLEEMLEISRAKSTLPFEVIESIAGARVSSKDQKIEKALEVITSNIAYVFWRLDDLTDIIRDFQANHLNSLLIDRGEPGIDDQSWTAGYKSLVNTLTDGRLEEVSEEVCGRLRFTLDELDAASGSTLYRQRFQRALLGYTRGWLS